MIQEGEGKSREEGKKKKVKQEPVEHLPFTLQQARKVQGDIGLLRTRERRGASGESGGGIS